MLRDFLNRETPSPLDPLIKRTLERMHEIDADTEEYQLLMKQLERLYKLKAKNRRAPVSRDTILIVVGNFAVTLLIVAYEQRNVMTTKAKEWQIRPR